MLSATESAPNDLDADGAPTLIQGVDNLGNMRFISNQEKLKTVLLNGYLQQRQSVKDLTSLDRMHERDNIGKCL